MPYKTPDRLKSIIGITATVAIMLAFLFAANQSVARRVRNKQINEQQAHTDQVICERVNRLYTIIQAQLRLAMSSNPKIMYYQQHPAELKRVQDGLSKEITAFAPQPCPTDGRIN